MRITGEQRITLEKKQIESCKIFASNSAETQQPIEFGSRQTRPRGVKEVARDNLIGKLAEVAFATFLQEKFCIKVDLDFNVYPRGLWDRDDFVLNGLSVDIKATRPGGRWMLIELNKLEFRKNEGKLPSFFLFAVTGWDRTTEEQTGEVTLVGYSALQQICHIDRNGEHSSRICENIPHKFFWRKERLYPEQRLLSRLISVRGQ